MGGGEADGEAVAVAEDFQDEVRLNLFVVAFIHAYMQTNFNILKQTCKGGRSPGRGGRSFGGRGRGRF